MVVVGGASIIPTHSSGGFLPGYFPYVSKFLPHENGRGNEYVLPVKSYSAFSSVWWKSLQQRKGKWDFPTILNLPVGVSRWLTILLKSQSGAHMEMCYGGGAFPVALDPDLTPEGPPHPEANSIT